MFISYSHSSVVAKIREILGEKHFKTFFYRPSTTTAAPSAQLAISGARRATAPASSASSAAPRQAGHPLSLKNVQMFTDTPFGKAAAQVFYGEKRQEFFAVYGLFNAPDPDRSDNLDEMLYKFPSDLGYEEIRAYNPVQVKIGYYTHNLLIHILWFTTCASLSITKDLDIFNRLLDLTNEVRFLFFLKNYADTNPQLFFIGRDVIAEACKKSPGELNLDKLKQLFLLCSTQLVAPSTLILSLYSAVQRILGCSDNETFRTAFLCGIENLPECKISDKVFTDPSEPGTFRMQPETLVEIMKKPEIELCPQTESQAALISSGATAPSSESLPFAHTWARLHQLLDRYARTNGALQTFLSSQEKKGIMGDMLQATRDAAMFNLLTRLGKKRSLKNEPPHTFMFCLLIDLWVQLSRQESHTLFNPSAMPCNNFLKRLIQCLDEDSLNNDHNRERRPTISELFTQEPAPPQRAEMIYKSWSVCLAVLVPRWTEHKYKMIMDLVNNNHEHLEILLKYLSTGRLHAPGRSSKRNWPENFNGYLTFCCDQFRQYRDLYQSTLVQQLDDLEARMEAYNIPEIFRIGNLSQLALPGAPFAPSQLALAATPYVAASGQKTPGSLSHGPATPMVPVATPAPMASPRPPAAQFTNAAAPRRSFLARMSELLFPSAQPKQKIWAYSDVTEANPGSIGDEDL